MAMTFKKPAGALGAVLILAGALASVSADAAPRGKIALPATIKPTDMIELNDGKKVPAQQVQDELNQLQEAIENRGFSLRKSDGRSAQGKKIYAFPGQDKDAADEKRVFAARIAKLRARQANGFSELVRPRGAKKSPVRGQNAAGIEGVLPLAPTPAPAPAPAPSPGGFTPAPFKPAIPPAPAGKPEPKDEPLSTEYEEALGQKDKAAIYVSFALEDQGDSESVGCEGSVEGGVYLFNEKRPLAKAVLKGGASSTAISGSLELYLIGKMVDGFPKTGSASVPDLHKSISPPEIKYTYGFRPISIALTLSVTGELGMALTNKQSVGSAAKYGTSDTKGTCTVGVIPYVRGSARATATVSAVVYRIGVEGNLTLIDLKLPATASIMLFANPLAFRETFDASLEAKFLDGNVSFFVETNIPRRGQEKAWDIDWDQIYRTTLLEWDGFVVKEQLAHFAVKQTPFQ